jgi:hypothetical protein
MMHDLNAIAPLITLFFLVTYAMTNLVMIVEQSLKPLSFRPFFEIPSIVPDWACLVVFLPCSSSPSPEFDCRCGGDWCLQRIATAAPDGSLW